VLPRRELADRRKVPRGVVGELQQLELPRGAIPAEREHPLVGLTPLPRGLRLVEAHERGEEARRVALEIARRGEALRHLRREVALAVHHELEVVRRRKPRLPRERAEREAAVTGLL